jgi:hypothetical protein
VSRPRLLDPEGENTTVLQNVGKYPNTDASLPEIKSYFRDKYKKIEIKNKHFDHKFLKWGVNKAQCSTRINFRSRTFSRVRK